VDYRRIITVSLESLMTHKFRTFLTMLGIIFGVAAVIAMLSIGEGAKQDALEQIEILGMQNIIVEGVIPGEEKGSDIVGGRSPGLTEADADNLRQFDKVFKAVVTSQILDGFKAYYADAESDASVVATSPAYMPIMNLRIQRGSFIRAQDLTDYNQVCVIGNNIKRSLFAFSDPIGQQIRLRHLYYTVIGVVEEKAVGASSFQGVDISNVNDNIYIPRTTALKKVYREADHAATKSGLGDDATARFNMNQIDQIILNVRKGQDIPTAAALARRIMERRHRGVPDFTVIVPEALLAQSQRTQRIFNIVMGAIAGISLLVGGIGIMNIMLASVLERTREIGVRRAVGASRRDIMSQFLIEAVTICLIGCVIGVFAGLGLAKGISSYADWRTIISVFSIILAVGVSTAVGLIFGFFPARKAASLDPIEALRYE